MADSPRVNLPFLTSDLPGIGGVLRTTDEDFIVDEELPYAASGTGDHVFVHLEKRGMTTPQAVQAVARALRIRGRDIGVAGMKDRHAVTRQWVSLPPPTTPDAALALVLEGITVIAAVRHNHKLRTGHVRANRFILRVRDCVPDAATRARAIFERLSRAPGAPNWYGEQRFGRSGDNAERGRALLTGERGSDRKMDRFLVSALQSELFNAWLVARMADGLYARVLAGDVLHKVGGGMFTCEDPSVDEARLVAGELVVTGPMFGVEMRQAAGPAGEREDAILAAAGLARDSFAKVARIAEGTRRDATISVGDPSVRTSDTGIEVAFALPAGAYATAVMRELMKNE
ncbi:MAG TPA: tRNA pseudouridine(13) synthase TruD [Kofleriaceae bacterium]|nr:tRNA pseudouridine(13) synthase TruD [Kofleriaceae bacterium]